MDKTAVYQKLVWLRGIEEERARTTVARSLAELQRQQEALRALEDAASRSVGPLPTADLLLLADAASQRMQGLIRRAQDSVGVAEEKVQGAQQQHQASTARLRSVERVQSDHRSEVQRETQRQERKQMDEVAAQRHVRATAER